MDFIDAKLEQYICAHTDPEDSLLRELERETRETLELPQMLTGRLEGQFLKMLAALIAAERVLEVGTFSGYGALSMASALPEWGELFTCEVDPGAIAVARRYFEKSPFGSRIRLLEGDALQSIRSLQGPLDLAFIDADKVNYQNYYEAILPLMRPNGLIAVDNVLWSGGVLDPRDDSSHAIARFNDTVFGDGRVDHVMLPVRDGIYLLRKK
ncbi:MAG: O-methyltransferase [Nitrospinaceae bacterium]